MYKIKELFFEDFWIFGLSCLGILLIIIFLYFIFTIPYDESYCVQFYKDSGYILERCEKYEEKLKDLEVVK